MVNHMPPSAMDDAFTALKVGGHFCTGFRAFYDVPGQKDGYRDKLDAFEKAGLMKRILLKEFTRGFKGGIDLFTEQPSVAVVYLKLKN